MQKTHYRPDIEGLRAIAILAVVACHAKLPYMEGGFVGVDIFFVLSGYLITGLLVREIEQTGQINFLSFYARRFKRLLPGLVLMLVVSSLVAFVILSPDEQIMQARIARSSFAWLSNFQFIFASYGYFDAGRLIIFLHTWSLAVEEQFYLVWPALILLLVRSKANLLQGLTLVLVACLALSIYLSSNHPLWGFYSMPSRGWQFALGGIVCLLATAGLPSKYYSATARTLAGYSGLALILASILLIDEQMTYPGIAALLPSVGAALILFAQCSPVSSALSIKPMQTIGKVSYSWYLWHWPVLILGGVLYPASTGYQLFLVAASLLLAVIAYYTVEMPIRNSSPLPRIAILASVLTMTLGASLSSGWKTKAAEWQMQPDMLPYLAAMMDKPQIYQMNCDTWYYSADRGGCRFSKPEAARHVVLFGDSFAGQWFSAFAALYADEGWSFTVFTKSACPMVDEPIYYDMVDGIYTVCDEWRNSVVEYIGQLKPEIVFIGSSAAYELTEQQWVDGTQRILVPLSQSAKQVFVIRGTPIPEFHGTNCLARKEWQPEMLSRLSKCESAGSVEPDNQVLAALQEAIKPFPNARILDLNEMVCPGNICKARRGDYIVYRDIVHVTDKFVRLITPQIREKIAEAQ